MDTDKEVLHQKQQDEKHDKDLPDTGKDVKVKIDDKDFLIHRGSHSVSELKVLFGVDPSKELDQIIDGQLTPLDDSKKIVIQGGEEFISHVRGGGSS